MTYLQDTYKTLEEAKEHKRIWTRTFDTIDDAKVSTELFRELWQLQEIIWELEGLKIPK